MINKTQRWRFVIKILLKFHVRTRRGGGLDDGGMIKAKVRRNLGRWGQRKDECERKRLADPGILVPIGPLHRMLDRGPDDDDDSRNGE